MISPMKTIYFLSPTLLLVTLISIYCNLTVKRDYYPTKEVWLQYQHPEEIGFDHHGADSLHAYFDSIQAHSLFVLYRGKVVFNWGDNTRRMRCASIRKSLLNALIGMAIDEGKMDLDQSVTSLINPATSELNSLEKKATIEHLLSSSSGIYLPAAYEPEVWTKQKPVRGSHQPGEFWYYNNWDFNVLGAIYDQISKNSIANDFQQKIAIPIGMQDYRPDLDFKYFYEGDIPVPAYLFKLSTRDLARFGLLYLRNGRWKNEQLISSSWVAKSTQPVMIPWEGTGYGYLWWNTNLQDGSSVYYASGTGEQDVFIVPSKDLVVVIRADTYLGPEIKTGEGIKILQMLCDIQQKDKVRKNPECLPVKWNQPEYESESIKLEEWLGSYSNNITRQLSIVKKGGNYRIETKIADFTLKPQSDTTAWIEDLNIMASFRKSESKSGSSFLERNKLVIYR